MKSNQELTVRQISEGEAIPYPLLLQADETREAINSYIFNSEIYVCESGNLAIAVYALQIVDRNSIEIKNIAVDVLHRGKGIGTDLLKRISEDVCKRGFTSLLIGTGDHSKRQLELYRKLGFTSFQVISDFFINNYAGTNL